MTTALSMAHGVKSHLSLNVADLERSVAFYRVLFGAEPAKHHSDYAKFVLQEPPIVFSLTPHPPAAGGSLSCLGLHVSGPEAVHAAHERLLAAGLAPQGQDGTVCGYARQNKCWVADPDRKRTWPVSWASRRSRPPACWRSPKDWRLLRLAQHDWSRSPLASGLAMRAMSACVQRT